MGQQHERGLGNWQAELAEWPGLFLSAHGALQALNDACAGLQVDAPRMARNIDALQGLVFAEAAAAYLAAAIGRPQAHALLENMSGKALATGRHLADILAEAVQADATLGAQVDLAHLATLFDATAAATPARTLAQQQLQRLRSDIATLDAVPHPALTHHLSRGQHAP
jgi:3-carboxy-cis,cis-muconate cycloisomerase